MKVKILYSLLLVLLTCNFGFSQTTFTSIASGNWSSITTWSQTGTVDADGIPDADDNVVVNKFITITENAACATITLNGNNTKITVNNAIKLEVSGKITAASSNSSTRNNILEGAGTIICASLDLGTATTTPSQTKQTVIISSIANLTITNDLLLYSNTDGSFLNNVTFSLEKGILLIGGQIKTVNEGGTNTSTFNTPTYTSDTSVITDPLVSAPFPLSSTTESYDKTLVLSYIGNPFDLSATGASTIGLSGDKSTVKYAGIGNQSIYNTQYYNLNLAKAGAKGFPTPTINIINRLSIDATVMANLGSGGTHTAKTMVLGFDLKASGTWGGTTSTAANINTEYFMESTGIITVGVPCSGSTKTWSGSAWTGGTPTLADDIVFAGNYDSSTNLIGDKLSGCSCTVTSGNVIFDSGHTLEITNQVAVNSGSLTFKNTASLIQYTDTPNTGNITYIRHSTPLYKYDYTFWSSPVAVGPSGSETGMTLTEFSPETIPPTIELSGFQSFYNDKWSYTAGTTVMEPGVGYAVMAPAEHLESDLYAAGDPFEDGDTFVGTFTGVPNNGLISVPVIGTWQLVGNPYPSSIDTDTFIEANPNLYGTFYFWTHASRPSSTGDRANNYSSADYASFNNTGGVSTDPEQITPPAIGSIGAGQGFFIGAYSTDPIIFTNAMRAGGNNSQFFKMSKKTKVATEKNRIWLNLTNEEGLFKQILIGYVPGATNSYDRLYDGVSFSNNKYGNFYSINNGTKLSIQGRALPFADTEEIPLGFNVKLGKKPAQSSQFTISISSADGDLEAQPVYLYDKVTNNTYDLRQNAYSFPSADGTFLDRFVLKFTNKTLGTDNFENTNEELTIAVKNKAITVNAKAQRIEKIVIYDIAGKAIFTKDKIGNSTVEITSLKASNQVLLVKVSLENGFTTTKKIILN